MLAGPAFAQPAGGPPPVIIKGRPAHPTRLLAKVRTGRPATAHAAALAASDLTTARGFSQIPGLVVLELDPRVAAAAAAALAPAGGGDVRAAQLEERMRELRASGLFEYVEPDYIVSAHAVPNDAWFANGTLWGLRNYGQNGGASGVDVDASRAWDLTTGSTDVIVAVVDSGIRYTHTELASQMWHNPGEFGGNGVDDDGNGYVDDVFGINANAGNGDPMDDEGHGTHVAGTIGAAANNGQPHVGVAWNVRLMALKFLGSDGTGPTSDAITCINYAVAKGARVINTSWGQASESAALRDAIAAAGSHGVLVVASAGNEGANSDVLPEYPAALNLDNIISVAAIDRFGNRANFSNFGIATVDLGAPGVEISSLDAGSDTATAAASGTSMAAPHVAGVAALVLARYPGISLPDLRDRLLQTTTPTASLESFTVTGGRVNAYQALANTPSGSLRIVVSPLSGTLQFNGRTTPVSVRVTDLVGVTGATVTGTLDGGGPVTFLDNGIAPDAAANDSCYTANLTMPASGSQLTVAVTASASGKTSANQNVTYPLQPPPANDDFANRIPLEFTAGSVTGGNRGATREPGEPLHAGSQGDTSVWWTWTAGADATVTIDTVGSDFDTMLAVYTGNSVDALTEVASNDDIDGPSQPSRVTFSAVAGTAYQIAVLGWNSKAGHITVNLHSSIPPANDNLAQATRIEGSSYSITGSNVNGTREAGEPLPPFPGAAGDHSVWWVWTAPSSGTATVSTQGLNVSTDVGVYLGDAVDSLVRVPGRTAEENGSLRGQVTFAAVAGTTYRIVVASRVSGSVGGFTLALNLTAGPANDLFENAIVLSGNSLSVSGDTTGATREVGEVPPTTDGYGASVWWQWTATETGAVRVVPVNATFGNVIIAAYEGPSVAAAQLIASNRVAGPSQSLPLSVRAGVTYHLSADLRYGTGPLQFNLSWGPAPPNDFFADRISLAGTSVQTTGSQINAGQEVGEPVHHEHATGSSSWWTWTAPASGTADILAWSGGSALAVYTGSDLTSLVRVANSYFGGYVLYRSRFHAVAGEPYQIAVDSYFGTEGTFPLTLTLADSPPNDDFADRATLTGTSAHAAGDNTHATVEVGEDIHGVSQLGASDWWTWKAPAAGSAIVTVSNAGFLPLLAISTGDQVTAQTPVAGFTGSFIGPPIHATFHVVPGTEYQIAVGTNSVGGTFDLDVVLVDTPVNDMFADRTAITGSSVSVAGTNLGATDEPDERSSVVQGRGGGSVWWSWTAPASGAVRISTLGSDFDTALTVYSGTNLSGLQVIGSNDNVSSSDYTSEVAVAVTAGTAYSIAVAGANWSTGAISLQVAMIDPPANDNFAAPVALAGGSVEWNGSNAGATVESGEPPYGYSSVWASVWFTWTAPITGAAVVTATGPQGSLAANVFAGSTLADPVPVFNSIPSYSPGPVRFHAIAGTTYRIRVANLGSRNIGAEVKLMVNVTAGPSNDMFADRLTLAGEDVRAVGRLDGATLERDESTFGGSRTMWWSWTAPRSGRAYFRSSGTAHHVLVVHTGSSLNTLQPVGTVSGSSNQIVVPVQAGTTYQIELRAADTFPGGSTTLHVLVADPPPNDSFSQRALISGAGAAVTATNLGATREPSDPYLLSTYSPTANVWWSWTAPASGVAVVRALSSEFNPLIDVYTGISPDGLTRVVPSAVTDRECSIQRFAFPAIAGGTYQIAVDGYSGGVGTFDLEVDVHEPPANDDWHAGIEMSGTNWVATGNNVGATRDPDDHSLSFAPRTLASVWWVWTAPATGTYVASAVGRDFEAFLEVYAINVYGRLFPVSLRRGNYAGAVAFRATAGVTYQFAVDGRDGRTGDFDLSLYPGEAPTVSIQASSASVTADSPVVLDAVTTGSEPLAYQWSRNGRMVPGATAREYAVPSMQQFDAGDYTVIVYNPVEAASSAALSVAVTEPPPSGARLTNLSTRGLDLTGDNVLIPGFVVAGTGSKKLLIRAVGPSLAAEPFNLSGVLPNPRLKLMRFNGAGYDDLLANDDWGTNANVAELTRRSAELLAFPLLNGSTDAAVLVDLQPGQYTLVADDPGGKTGITIVELYDADENDGSGTARLINISTRGFVGTGDNIMIPGFVVSTEGPKTLLIRVVGPTLAQPPFNVADVLIDPTLTIYRHDFEHNTDDVILTNDNWGDGPEAVRTASVAGQVQAFPLPNGSRDAAFVVTLKPGVYTVHARGADGDTGVALVEVYAVE